MAKKTDNKIGVKVDAVAYLEENGYPEVGRFEEKKALQKFYKQLPIELLENWCEEVGIEYAGCEDSEAIHRMRVCMAILYTHFPKEPAKSKKKSKYADYTTEALVQIAIDNEVPVEPTEDMRILRMRTIMALRSEGHIE